jgi:alpha-glucosidase
MATDGLATYTLYEDDGNSLAYQQGASARTDISCRVLKDFVTVEIEEHFDNYRPSREEYEVIVHTGGRTLQKKVQAGQGKIVIRL